MYTAGEEKMIYYLSQERGLAVRDAVMIVDYSRTQGVLAHQKTLASFDADTPTG